MIIQDKIQKSPEFNKLLSFVNTPLKNKKGSICIAKNTTIDTQDIIIKLLKKDKKSFIYSNLYNNNILKYLNSLLIIKKIKFNNLKKYLGKYSYKRQEKVLNKGEYSILGDIITLWPSLYSHAIRISFWGNDYESIELIDEVYRTKIKKLNSITIGDESLLIDEIEKKSLNISAPKITINKYFIFFTNLIKNNSSRKLFKINKIINFSFTYPSLFFHRFDLLVKNIEQKAKNNWEIFISTMHKSHLPKYLHKYCLDNIFKFKSGFASPLNKLVVYTDRELFGSIYIASEKQKSDKSINRYLAQLEGEIVVSDYIVHEDYGIAVYKGIKQKKVLNKTTDYLILEYAQGDKLSVPIKQIHKLTKYIGPDNSPPKITRLGRTNWNTIKQKVKNSVVLLAKELLKHYAKFEIIKSDKFENHEWEDKFASEFEFPETEDQTQAINEINQDLKSKKPANRLLIGDVGFGKTEVAIRAAFKTVMNNKQVAVLCPTTILVSQHYSVFKHRMRNYPINIKTLSRFGTKKNNRKTVNKIRKGKTDIIIGTHRLLSNDIKFNNLGLLIIDEEQKFGVAQKEKLSKLSYSCNILSMSATPIPRTLSMALSNIRDLSIITTPPPGRKPIKTYVEYINWNKIVKIIQKEKNRNGQIYFLHNEVRTIDSIKNKLTQLLPDIKFKVAHGQMHPSTLEKIMREFYEHKFDCLICTTIIENGIDIKNVNTIIINKAQKFGLAQLYQLRGRVGRSNNQSYCYLFYTQKNLFKKTKKKTIFIKSKERLESLLESQELGSGYKIASKDLEIRGAGNLLGRNQHGNISSIGLSLYSQLLADEINRLKKQKIK